MPTIRHDLDPTGLNPNNYVSGEVHTLDNFPNRALAPTYGAYFTESAQLFDVATGIRLVRNTQYRCMELAENASEIYGKEICYIFLIIDPTVSSSVRINYQALGGPYNRSADAIVQIYNTIVNSVSGAGGVNWPAIVGKPSTFQPGPHLHALGDMYGFEYLVNAMERIRSAILLADSNAFEGVLSWVSGQVTAYHQSIDAQLTGLAGHITDTQNPHGVTKAQVGLGNVANYGIATDAEARAGTLTSKYITPANMKYALGLYYTTVQTDQAIAAAVAGGAVNLSGYYTSTQTDSAIGTAVAGLNSTLTNISNSFSNALGTHTGNTFNPHGTTKAQVGLSNVPNYGAATNAEAAAGTAGDKLITPVTLKYALDTQSQNWAIPAGAVVDFAYNGGVAPTGYLKANGAAVSRTVYATLFTAIGTQFGAGDGITTFNLPNYRGTFSRAWDDGQGIDVGRNLGTFQADAFKSHNHNIIHYPASDTAGAGISGAVLGSQTNTYTENTGDVETRPANWSVLRCIKY